MIAVIFEAEISPSAQQDYLQIAAALAAQLQQLDGFISIERFQSLSTPGRLLSLSFWRDEAAVAAWRNMPEHRAAQQQGRAHIFSQYRLRVAAVLRDYDGHARQQAPADSQRS